MDNKNDILRRLPSVDELVRGLKGTDFSQELMVDSARIALIEARSRVLSGDINDISIDDLRTAVIEKMAGALKSSIKRVINATGTILHTNIGRALLSEEACEAVRLACLNNINLEMDTATGERGERDSLIAPLIMKLTVAEDAAIVNNNAAAVLITLNTLAEGREVIISRGELIEIGGSFRLPEIIKKSGCILREVGTTNRTHAKDYISAINDKTALIFKAHTSNYKVVGFTAEVELKELVDIGRQHNIPVVEDLGSGSIADLSLYGLPKEPVVAERVATGADIVTFSGDKLLGGPQAGIIAGRKEIVGKIKKNPLKRALRADKLTLAALEATLRLYLNKDTLVDKLPTLKLLARSLKDIEESAIKAAGLLKDKLGSAFDIMIEDGESIVGGGSLPGHNLPTKVISVRHDSLSPDDIYRKFLSNEPPILGRINKDRFLLDMMTVQRPEDVVPGRGL